MERACNSGQRGCLDFVEENEELVEQWWRDRDETESLKKMAEVICVGETKACCKKGHFGKTCKTCPGGAKKPCNKNGTCDGDGTRRGAGKCKCNEGFKGKSCKTVVPMPPPQPHTKDNGESSPSTVTVTESVQPPLAEAEAKAAKDEL